MWTLRIADEVAEKRLLGAWAARRALLKRVAEEAAIFARERQARLRRARLYALRNEDVEAYEATVEVMKAPDLCEIP